MTWVIPQYSFSNINDEIDESFFANQSSTATISLGDTRIRNIANKISGTISVRDAFLGARIPLRSVANSRIFSNGAKQLVDPIDIAAFGSAGATANLSISLNGTGIYSETSGGQTATANFNWRPPNDSDSSNFSVMVNSVDGDAFSFGSSPINQFLPLGTTSYQWFHSITLFNVGSESRLTDFVVTLRRLNENGISRPFRLSAFALLEGGEGR